MDRRTVYWIWLSEACGPESPLPTQLYSQVGDIQTIYEMDAAGYQALGFVSKSQITALCDKDLYRAEHIVDVCEKNRIGILPLTSIAYPHRLQNIPCPPTVLYYKGNLPDFNNRLAVSVIGTRGMTEAGRITGYRIAYELAVAGTVVVSGMALGVDGIAQKAALDAGGTSVAVLGSAIDRCYPAEHKPLYDRLAKYGAVLSEYAPGSDTRPWHFPQRNRIISGLCQGTLVIEGGVKSGALITAQTAYAQGRTVFAVPGDTTDPARAGTNNLIKAGAVPVTGAMDVLSVFLPLYEEMVYLDRMENPAYYKHYDDTLRYGAERVAQKHAEAHPKRNAPVPSPKPQPQSARKQDKVQNATIPSSHRDAPLDMTAREEPLGVPEREDTPTQANVSGTQTLPPLNEREQAVLSMIASGKSYDDMCRAGIPKSLLNATITMLELKDRITILPGDNYKLKN